MTKNDPPARHWSASEWGSMDWDPELSAAEIESFAPLTFAAVVNAYVANCEADENGDRYRGRHVETAEPTGGYL